MVSRRMRYHKTCSKTVSPKVHIAASISAAFFACTLSNPADVIMTRWASAPTLGKNNIYQYHMIKSIVREEGPLVLYRGWTYLCSSLAPLPCVMMPYDRQGELLGLGIRRKLYFYVIIGLKNKKDYYEKKLLSVSQSVIIEPKLQYIPPQDA